MLNSVIPAKAAEEAPFGGGDLYNHMIINELMPILSFLGLGGIIGAFFNSIWERNKTISLQKQEYKRNT